MKNISTTFIANIVAVLVFVLPVLGIEIVDERTLAGVVASVAGVVSVLYVFYGRYKAGGINAFGIRLKK
jgi:Flp pilus assembly protein protease CpaA